MERVEVNWERLEDLIKMVLEKAESQRKTNEKIETIRRAFISTFGFDPRIVNEREASVTIAPNTDRKVRKMIMEAFKKFGWDYDYVEITLKTEIIEADNLHDWTVLQVCNPIVAEKIEKVGNYMVRHTITIDGSYLHDDP